MGKASPGGRSRLRGDVAAASAAQARRRRMLLLLCGAGLVLAGFAVCLFLTRGFHRAYRFLTVPSLEADSGIKYTPTGAIKRQVEKVDERREATADERSL